MTRAAPQADSFIGRFTVLFGAMRELWIVLGVKFLAGAAYQLMNITLVLWLSADLGFGDKEAGRLVAAWSIVMTVFTVLVGSLTDAIGLRRTFLLGFSISALARLAMIVTDTREVALAALVPLAFGEALCTPVLVAAVRRYSTTAQRSISFSSLYVMLNVGFYVAYEVFDAIRYRVGELGTAAIPLLGFKISTYQMLLFISMLIDFIVLPVVYFGIRGGAEATDEGVRITPEERRHKDRSLVAAFSLTIRDTLRETARNLLLMMRQSGFYRLLGFLTLIAFLKFIFMHMSYAYPKFGIRELGPGAPVAGLYGLNSVLIIFLVPLVGVLTQKMSAYRVVTFGAVLSSASLFIMALPRTWFEGMADGVLGHLVGHWYLGLEGEISPWYVMIFFYVIVLSLGEAFYSPRVYEYAAAIAPKGQEASYAALSYAPFFLGKLLVGLVSGELLERYCPEIGPRNSSMMWLVVGLITLVAPLGLIVLRAWIRVPEAGREAEAAG